MSVWGSPLEKPTFTNFADRPIAAWNVCFGAQSTGASHSQPSIRPSCIESGMQPSGMQCRTGSRSRSRQSRRPRYADRKKNGGALTLTHQGQWGVVREPRGSGPSMLFGSSPETSSPEAADHVGYGAKQPTPPRRSYGVTGGSLGGIARPLIARCSCMSASYRSSSISGGGTKVGPVAESAPTPLGRNEVSVIEFRSGRSRPRTGHQTAAASFGPVGQARRAVLRICAGWAGASHMTVGICHRYRLRHRLRTT